MQKCKGYIIAMQLIQLCILVTYRVHAMREYTNKSGSIYFINAYRLFAWKLDSKAMYPHQTKHVQGLECVIDSPTLDITATLTVLGQESFSNSNVRWRLRISSRLHNKHLSGVNCSKGSSALNIEVGMASSCSLQCMYAYSSYH